MLLFKTIFTKDLLYFWRYKANAIMSLSFSLIICIVLLYLPFLNSVTEEKGDIAIIAPYFLWMVMTSNFSINEIVSNDAISGVTEQLYINTSSYFKLLLVRSLSSFILSAFPLVVFVFIISLISKVNILPFLYVIPIILIGIPAIWGLSLIAGALVLRYKRIDTVVSIISAMLFAGVSYFSTKSKIFAIVMPFAHASRISSIILRNLSSPIVWTDFIIILANSVVYMVLGILCFKLAEKSAKKYGLLGMH